MTEKYTVPRGTYDVLPSEASKWEYCETLFAKVAHSFGYSEVRTPIFEHSEVFERSAGDTTDIVEKEMYRFQDKKGRWFALRPEGTAPVVRSYIENNLGAEGNVTKLYYIGPMFRYDRPQAGRTRQFSQYGVECIGSSHPYYDAEVICVFYTYLQKLGLSKYMVEINSLGCPNCSKDYDVALRNYFQALLPQLCPDCQNRFAKNPKRLLDCKVPSCKVHTQKAPVILDYLDPECKANFNEVQSYLTLLKVPFVINPRIVRGLDYYTQTAFEFVNTELGAQNALGGGGRYNGLIEQMGGKPTPAIGFAGGFSRLLLSLEKENIAIGEPHRPAFYIANFGEGTMKFAISILQFFRERGIYAEFEPEKTSVKSQMKSADKCHARFCIMIGENELTQQAVTVKDMTSGQQTTCAIDKLAELL